MSLATLKGHTCSAARVQCGDWGAWWLDANLTEPEELAGPVPIAFAGQALAGFIVSGGAIDGRAAYRVVGGAGGLGKELPEKAYADDAGVQMSVVLGDIARESGETIQGAPTTRLGPHYVRTAGLASDTLNLLAPRAWRVDFDGVIRFGKRPTVAYKGDGQRVRRDPAARIVEIATDDVATLLPGVTIDGSAPATDVEYELTADRLTVRVWAGSRTARTLDAIERIVLGLFPDIQYRGAFEFRVVSQSGERLNLQPVRSASGMPLLSRVPVRPGMAGLKATVLPGSLVVVQFLDADPSRPVVTNHDAPDAPGWMPIVLELGGPGALGVARLGDAVICGPYAGTIVAASARVKAAL